MKPPASHATPKPFTPKISHKANTIKSGLRTVSGTWSVHLPPFYVDKPLAGARDSLDFHLQKYLPQFGGALIAYKALTPKSTTAAILYDYPYFHFDVTVDVLLFSPTPGIRLVGIVNKVSPGHIGLIVHGTFNASILAKHIPHPQYKFNKLSQTWEYSSSHGQQRRDENSIGVDSVVAFQVVEVQMANEHVTLLGSLKGAAPLGLVKSHDDVGSDLGLPEYMTSAVNSSVEPAPVSASVIEVHDDSVEVINIPDDGSNASPTPAKSRPKRKRKSSVVANK